MTGPEKRDKFSAVMGETEGDGLGILLGLFVNEEIEAAETGCQLVDYLNLPAEQGGPGPSDGDEMSSIRVHEIIEGRQQETDGEA
jgi:hypothetical protein